MSRGLPRVVEPETLDVLAPDDPAAQRSRRDLRRIHRAMGTRSTLRRALRRMTAPRRGPSGPPRVLELGAGDGSLLLGVAAACSPGWQGADLTLLDRQPLLAADTVAAYARLGWHASAAVADVLEWAAAPDGALPAAPAAGGHWDLIVANLFLHHFEAPALRVLLAAAAARGDRFLACEPRRSWLALAGSRLVGALGAGRVTREDAVTSVHAGFHGSEIGALWPGAPGAWRLSERPAGLFGHCFVAERIDAGAAGADAHTAAATADTDGGADAVAAVGARSR